MKLMWFAQQSNYVLWFTYTKACVNTTLAVFGFKNVMFKATDKVGLCNRFCSLSPCSSGPRQLAVCAGERVLFGWRLTRGGCGGWTAGSEARRRWQRASPAPTPTP